MMFRGSKKYTVTFLVVLVLLLAAPAPLRAQQQVQQQTIVVLLEQLAQLTQLVIQLQAQVLELQAKEREAAQRDEEIVLPVHVYVLHSPYENVRALSSSYTIREMFDGPDGVNDRFWKQASVRWNVVDVKTHTVTNGADREFYLATLTNNDDATLDSLTSIAKDVAVPPGVFPVFIMRSFDTIEENGVYLLKRGIVFVSETNGRSSGRDYMTYLIAHELGHALGLLHEGSFYNLMHRGREENTVSRRDRTRLLPDQIVRARGQARIGVPALW